MVKIPAGTSSCTGDILATIWDLKVYNGTSSCTSDLEFTFDGNLTIDEFAAVWYAVKYCYGSSSLINQPYNRIKGIFTYDRFVFCHLVVKCENL